MTLNKDQKALIKFLKKNGIAVSQEDVVYGELSLVAKDLDMDTDAEDFFGEDFKRFEGLVAKADCEIPDTVYAY